MNLDWPLAILRTRDALRGIIAALFALAGLTSPRNRGEVSRAQPVTERGMRRDGCRELAFAAALKCLRRDYLPLLQG